MEIIYLLDLKIQRLWQQLLYSTIEERKQFFKKILKICLQKKIKELEIEAFYCMPQEGSAWFETQADLEFLSL